MTLLLIAVCDQDAAAVERALTLLGDDPDLRAVALEMAQTAVAVQPMLRTHEARERALDLLAAYDAVFRLTTGRN